MLTWQFRYEVVVLALQSAARKSYILATGGYGLVIVGCALVNTGCGLYKYRRWFCRDNCHFGNALAVR